RAAPTMNLVLRRASVQSPGLVVRLTARVDARHTRCWLGALPHLGSAVVTRGCGSSRHFSYTESTSKRRLAIPSPTAAYIVQLGPSAKSRVRPDEARCAF